MIGARFHTIVGIIAAGIVVVGIIAAVGIAALMIVAVGKVESGCLQTCAPLSGVVLYTPSGKSRCFCATPDDGWALAPDAPDGGTP